MKNVRKHKEIKLSTTEKEETVGFLNQVLMHQNFSLKIYQP